jgi:hypothetical protein
VIVVTLLRHFKSPSAFPGAAPMVASWAVAQEVRLAFSDAYRWHFAEQSSVKSIRWMGRHKGN